MGDEKVGSIIKDNEMIKIENEQLYLNGQLMHDAHEVSKAIPFENIVIVLEGRGTENVLAFNKNGEQIWRIEPFVYEFPAGFSNIYVEDNDLKAFNMSGYEVKIDPGNGKILSEKWLK